jgi:ABC-type dipeptide/oligopeptide/nickel transport system permease component
MDFGSSLSKKQPINKLIKRCVPVSLAVTFPPFVLVFLFATALGTCVSFNRGKFLDKLLTVLSTIFIAFPTLLYDHIISNFFCW